MKRALKIYIHHVARGKYLSFYQNCLTIVKEKHILLLTNCTRLALCFWISKRSLIWLTTRFCWIRLDYMVELSKLSIGLNRIFLTDVNVQK